MRLRVLRGDRLRQIRENHNLSMPELARQIGTSTNQIWRYENGEADPSPYQLKRIAQELQVTTDYLLGLVDAKDEHLTEPELSAHEREFLTALREGRVRTLLRLLEETLPDEQQQLNVAGGDVAANGEPLDSVQRSVPS